MGTTAISGDIPKIMAAKAGRANRAFIAPLPASDRVQFSGIASNAAEATGGLWNALTKGVSKQLLGGLFLKYALPSMFLLSFLTPIGWAIALAGVPISYWSIAKGGGMIRNALESSGAKGVIGKVTHLSQEWSHIGHQNADQGISKILRQLNGIMNGFARDTKETMPALSQFVRKLRLSRTSPAYRWISNALSLMLAYREKFTGKMLHKMVTFVRFPFLRVPVLVMSAVFNGLFILRNFGKLQAKKAAKSAANIL